MTATKKKPKRVAKAARSPFRGPTQKPLEGVKTAKAKRQRAASKTTTKATAEIATAAKAAARKVVAKKVPPIVTPPPPREIEVLGEVSAPSGRLAIFDIGLAGFLERAALDPLLVVAEVPFDRVLRVVGVRVGTGRFADCWDHIAVELTEGDALETGESKKLGEAAVDFARLICMDRATLDHWRHDDSLDGKADFAFWGRDAADLARVMRAPALANTESYGWIDLAVADAEARADKAARLKSENRWLLATDLRPHSHHFHALAAARATRRGAGTIEVGGARVCLFFTTWGDGVYPIYLDLDHHERPIRIRIQLAPTVDARVARS